MIALFLGFNLHWEERAKAAELFEYNQSIQSIGMGGVRYAESSDSSIMLWNPAGLGTLSGLNWQLFNLGFGLNGQQIYQDLQDIGELNGVDSLSSFYGKDIWIGVGGNSSLALGALGFSVYSSGAMDFRLSNPAYPQLAINYLNDYGFVIGGGLSLGPSLFAGMNLKRITRKGTLLLLGPDELETISSSTLMDRIQDEGTGYGVDLGLLWKAPTPGNPTVSLSWKDVGSTEFIKTIGDKGPPRLKDNLTLGISANGSAYGLGFGTGLEYRHIMETGEPIGKKLHLGLELSLLFADLRAGLYQGYTTYGLGVDLWLLNLDAAIYGVETGAYPGQTKSERIQISLSMDLSFSPDFSYIGASGKNRRLKQRR